MTQPPSTTIALRRRAAPVPTRALCRRWPAAQRSTTLPRAAATGLIFIAITCAGCGTSRPASSGPYASEEAASRNPARAQELTATAAPLISTDPAHAEQLLREALAADLYHGPAHNNLGVIHLARGDLYEAAAEFEWARKLMPGHPDPRLNLALTLERAGRTDEAIQTYKAALETYPGHMPSLQALTRLQLYTGRPTDRTAHHLQEIALRGEDPSWRNWAQAELARRGRPRPASSSDPAP